MKKILFIFFMLFSINLYSQELYKKETTVVTKEQILKNSSKTTFTWKGEPVYKTSKGSLFIIKLSSKSGNYYKYYLPKTN